MLAFYTVHAPAKAQSENVDTAWQLFGPRIWDELGRKYGSKAAGFRPMSASSGGGTATASSW
ncbi:hypothetical protein EON66_10050 [archaeon]|nr:MAG: hypothetical protein EON66_10050 [archaeon]